MGILFAISIISIIISSTLQVSACKACSMHAGEMQTEGRMPLAISRQPPELILNFNRQMRQCCAIKCTSFQNERGNTVPQSALKLNSATAAAEIWHLEDHMLNVKLDHKKRWIGWHDLNSCGSKQGHMADSYEYGNELLNSVRDSTVRDISVCQRGIWSMSLASQTGLAICH